MFLHISEEESSTLVYEEEIIESEKENENVNNLIDAFTKSINIKNKIINPRI